MRYSKFLALIPVLVLCAAPGLSQAAVDVSLSVSFAPPVIPVYVQPPLPAPGYLFVPGYWQWDGMDYYWVPGTWVEPPVDGMLWTPGYWNYQDGFYVWSDGYWGPDVGFYGGVNYGFGYTGLGFQGGYWHGGAFFYNRAVANFGRVNIVNVYNTPVQVHESSHVSFNGGQGGLRAQPTVDERRAMSEHHSPPTGIQMQHMQQARAMPAMHAKQNGGRPQILTTTRAGDFAHPGQGAGLHNHQGPQPQSNGAGPAGPAMRGGPPQNQERQAPRDQVQQHEPVQQHDQVQQHEPVQPREQVEQHDQAPRIVAPRPPQARPESKAEPKHAADDKDKKDR